MKHILIVWAVVAISFAASPQKKRQVVQSPSDVSHHDVVKEHVGPVVDHFKPAHLETVHHEAVHHEPVHHVPVHHEPVSVAHDAASVPPAPSKGRSADFQEDEVPFYPQFGVKVDQQIPRVRKVVRSRARAVVGQGYGHNFQYVQPPQKFVAESRMDNFGSSKAFVAPYLQKPLYQANYDQSLKTYNPSYQAAYNKYFTQRTDDVPQPGGVVGPIHPTMVAPAGPADDRVEPPPKPIAILNMNQDVNYDGTFVYDFESENGIKSAVSGSTKRIEGEKNPVQVMSGSYSYFTPEGEPVETRWYADETGFHAEGSHLPVAPPVPDAIQRAVEYLNTLPKEEEQQTAFQPVPANPESNKHRFEQVYSPNYQQQYYDKPNYQQQQQHYKPNYQQQEQFNNPPYQQQYFDKPNYQQQEHYYKPNYQQQQQYFDKPNNQQQKQFNKPNYQQQHYFDKPNYQHQGQYSKPNYQQQANFPKNQQFFHESYPVKQF